jgi:PsbP-like protein
MTKHLKTLSTFLLVLAVLVVAYFASLYLANKAKQKEMAQQTNSNTQPSYPDGEGPDDLNPPMMRTYTNEENGFSFQYPADFQTGGEDSTYLPYGTNAKIKLTANFYHEIQTEHCDLSGKCTPTTKDLYIGVAVIPDSMQNIKNQADPMTQANYGDTTVYGVRQGVEGEGIFYDFIPLTSNKTLLVSHTFIDESVVANYQKAPGFLSYQKQSEIMADLFKSLKITK